MSDSLRQLSAALAGRYAVERELGAGGMATVYLGEDLRHHRRVAIKVFTEDLGASVGAARFLREIEIAAQLQHPNILPLLDSGEAGRLLYYVMPYVEGQSLRERLARERELPVDEAVRMLVEIVDALAHAHARGVVHRDIKPDNIMLTGRHALVADFGVAKAVSEASGQSGVTSMGVALGTPIYMAPEQAVADPHVDHRADLYAVGVLAYEILTGRPPFSGVTPQQVLAAHISETPDPVSRHRPGVSPALDQAIMRCLEKRAADRWQSADDLLAALEPLATPSGGTTPSSVRLPAVRRGVPAFAWVAGGLALVAAVALGWWRTRPPTVPLTIGRSDQLTSDSHLEISPDISPDGKLVAYAAGTSARMRIFIRPEGGGRTIPLSDDSTAVESGPRWSPDGSRILFLVGGGVSVAPALGGASTPVIPPGATRDGDVASATWSPDGSEIAFSRGDTVYRVPANGGEATVIGTGARQPHGCSWSPKATWIACVAGNAGATSPGHLFGNIAPSAIVLFPAAGGAAVTVVPANSFNESPMWSPDGRFLYFLSNVDGPQDIYALALGRSGAPKGSPMRLTTGLNAISFSLSADETRLVYAVYSARSNVWSLPIPSGNAELSATDQDAQQLTTGSQVIEAMSVSRDGRWLVYDSNLHGNADIYRIPIEGGTAEQLTSEPWDEFAPELSPDGIRVAYHSFRTGTRDIEVKPLDGGPVVRVTSTSAQESYPHWSPDGSAIAFTDQTLPDTAYVVRREPDGQWSAPRSLAPILWPTWSPDGKWIAGTGPGPRGSEAVFIEPADGGDARTVSDTVPGAGSADVFLVFSADSRSLFAKTHDAQGRASIWSLPVGGGSWRRLVRFSDPYWQSARSDVAASAHRFYFAIQDRQSDVYVAEVTRR